MFSTSAMRKQWHMINQDNVRAQMDLAAHKREKELNDKETYEKEFLNQIGCKVGSRTTKGQAQKAKSGFAKSSFVSTGPPCADSGVTYFNYLYSDKSKHHAPTLAQKLAVTQKGNIWAEKVNKLEGESVKKDQEAQDRMTR
jgi:hypothetical protein